MKIYFLFSFHSWGSGNLSRSTYIYIYYHVVLTPTFPVEGFLTQIDDAGADWVHHCQLLLYHWDSVFKYNYWLGGKINGKMTKAVTNTIQDRTQLVPTSSFTLSKSLTGTCSSCMLCKHQWHRLSEHVLLRHVQNTTPEVSLEAGEFIYLIPGR